MTQTVDAKVRDIIGEVLGVDPDGVKPESSLVGDLGADSLDIVELAMHLEDSFPAIGEIADEILEGLKTVSDVCNLIRSKEAVV